MVKIILDHDNFFIFKIIFNLINIKIIFYIFKIIFYLLIIDK